MAVLVQTMLFGGGLLQASDGVHMQQMLEVFGESSWRKATVAYEISEDVCEVLTATLRVNKNHVIWRHSSPTHTRITSKHFEATVVVVIWCYVLWKKLNWNWPNTFQILSISNASNYN